MDWIAIGKQAAGAVKKYQYVLLILALGVFLMALPGRSEQPKEEASPPEPTCTQENLEDRLTEILTQMEGVGKARVLLTEASGAETVYQTDEDSTTSDASGSLRRETVILSGENREETGLVRRVNPPAYLGAVVVCQGADRPSVKLAVVEAVSNATGISADRITVLKMK